MIRPACVRVVDVDVFTLDLTRRKGSRKDVADATQHLDGCEAASSSLSAIVGVSVWHE